MEPTSQRKCDLHWREGEWTVSSPRCVLSCWHTVHYTSKYLFPKLPVKSTQDIRALRPPKNIIYQINIDLVCSCFNAHQRNTIFYRNFLCVRVGVWAVKWLGFTITFDNRLAGHILLWSLYFSTVGRVIQGQSWCEASRDAVLREKFISWHRYKAGQKLHRDPS